MRSTAPALAAAAIEGGVLRAWAFDQGGAVLADTRAAPDALASALDQVGALPHTALITAGMGRVFRPLPCPPLPETLAFADQDGRPVAPIPGLSQTRPPQVTGGAETRTAGFLALDPDFDGVLCLPGPETAWLHISAGEVVSLARFVTTELARDMAARLNLPAEIWDAPSFDSTLGDLIARPERLALVLSSLRAEGLLQGLSEAQARARVWGAFMGAELAAARPYWLGQRVAVLRGAAGAGYARIADYYAQALATQGCRAQIHGDQDFMLRGILAARDRLAAR